MPPEKPIARYSFLPWLRQGLASSITRQDNPAQAGAIPPRAKIDVEAALNQGAPVPKQMQLHGPGDVIGIDPRAVIRTDPRHSINDFEPNYTPLVEFYDEDFPWRYTPAAAAPHERLRPWIYLVVLTPDEFTTGKAAATQLLTITVKDPNNSLPAPQETWGWAHVHVARDVSGTDGTPDQVLGAVRSVITQDTSQAISRLICPRKLHPNLTYYAFVIPTFESGRLAGLGQPIPADINGLAPAWGAGQDTFPVYYTWQFHTGEKGDFEYLVRLLDPAPADPRVGKRPMDVQQPAPDYNIPAITTPPVLELEGALKAIDMQSTVWPQREPFLTALTNFLNLPADLKLDGSGEEDDPLIAPPLYGQFPAAVERVGQADDPLWFHTLNLDPRNRTAAGLGTRVVQTHQDEYMDIAWKQVGMLQEANRKLRLAQLARFFASSLYVRHLANAPTQQVFALTSNLHSRVLIPQVQPEGVAPPAAPVGAAVPVAGAAAAGNAPAISVRTLLRQSAVPAALVSPAFRRALRPRGTLMLRAAPGAPRVQGRILERVVKGELTPALPKPALDQAIVLDDILQKTAPPPATGCLLSPLVVSLLYILAGTLRFLSVVIPALKDWNNRLDTLLESTRENQVVNLDNWNPQQVDQIPPAPTFVLTNPGDPLPPRGFGAQDSPQAVAFRSAMKETTALFAASLQPVPPRPALQLANITARMLAELQPAHTIAKRIKSSIEFDRFGILTPPLDPLDELLIAPDFPQAMYLPLKTISEELLLPNVGLIPPNTITLLKTNQKFVESYLVGLNHEMAREFIWREYPTDQRSTYFRQFWAGTESNPNPIVTDKQRADKLKDIKPIHTWQKTSDLGGNNNRKPGPNAEFLVLLIRGDLFKRYPNTEVYAAKAEWHDPPLKEPGDPCEIFRTPASDEFFDDETRIRKPIFNGDIGPEIRFFGFDLDENTARGNLEHPELDPGWFFALREHPGEPRFGLDEPLQLEPANQWNDLTWANVAGSVDAVEAMNYIALSRPLTQVNIVGDENKIRFAAADGSNAASLAYILLQDPYKAYIHANEMLPESGA